MSSQCTKSKVGKTKNDGLSSFLPSGLVIGNKHKWRIGTLLGSGACGSVHELHYVGNESHSSKPTTRSYVVKLASMPPRSKHGAMNGKKRKKKTEQERNADLIHHEHTLLANRLTSLRGKYIPHIPEYNEHCAPPTSGILEDEESSNAWRYLVMERMRSPLYDLAPKIDGKTLRLGAVAQHMLTCLEHFHKLQFVYIDVKLDNFMVAMIPSKSTPSSKISPSDVSKSARMVDFGLVESLIDGATSKHRVDMFPNASMVGTPLYASLNVLRGHTPSRRDDLEALAYVIADIALLSAHAQSSTSSKNKAINLPTTMLPWKDGTSDEDIMEQKEQSLSSGEFYGMFEHAEDGDILKHFIGIVQALEYSKRPDYEKLHSLLGKLRGGGDIKNTERMTSSSSKKSGRTATATSRAIKRSKVSTSNDDDTVRDGRFSSFTDETSSFVAPESRHCVEGKSNIRAARASRRAALRLNIFDDEIDVATTSSALSLPSSDAKRGHKKSRDVAASLRNKENSSYGDNVDGSAAVKQQKPSPNQSHQSASKVEKENVNIHSDATGKESRRRRGKASQKQPALKGSDTSNADPLSPKVDVRLRYVDGPQADKTFDLPTGFTTIIGREASDSSKSSKKLKKRIYYSAPFDSQLSQEHIKIEVNVTKKNTKTIKVTDMESTNGTFVNGKEVRKGGWNNAFVGDRIQIGQYTLIVELS